MHIKDFFLDISINKKILVTQGVARINNLISSYEKETKNITKNIDCVNLDSILNTLYIYYESLKGYKPQKTIIDKKLGAYLLRGVAIKNTKKLKYFNDENMLTVKTCEEIHNKLYLIRSCGFNDKQDKNDPRIKDIALLIDMYENALASKKLHDRLSLIDEITQLLDTSKDAKQDIKLCFGAQIYYIQEDTEKLGEKEIAFLKKICKLSGSQNPAINIWEIEPSIDVLKNIVPKAKLFKAYGSQNEANYIVYDILKNNYSLNDVAIYYSNDKNAQALEAAFRSKLLPLSFTSNLSLLSNPYLSLARRIINWAKNNFSETSLALIFQSDALSIGAKDIDGKYTNKLGGWHYLYHVISAEGRFSDTFTIGDGYKRNREFLAHEKQLRLDANRENPMTWGMTLHEKLLDIFGEGDEQCLKISPYEIFVRIFDFLLDYARNGKLKRTSLKQMEQCFYVLQMDERKLEFADSLDFVDELMSRCGFAPDEVANSVIAEKISDWKFLNRNHTYVIGLSYADMQLQTRQSPVLRDSEMQQYLGSGFKPTIQNNLKLRDSNILRTLSTFSGNTISFGYSSFDAATSKDQSPSTFFYDLLSYTNTKLDDIQEFCYGKPDDDLKVLPGKNNSLAPKLQEKFSVSRLQALIECPKQYYFQNVANIPCADFFKFDPKEWLDPLNKGTLFHSIAEDYISTIFALDEKLENYKSIRAGLLKSLPVKVDINLLTSLADKYAYKMVSEFPSPSKYIFEEEKSELLKVCIAYFDEWHKNTHNVTVEESNRYKGKNYNFVGWRPLMVEKEFSKLPYAVVD
ncbi:MAG: PD-(D/E)XK nuclease family protein, partial [Coriobacteriales bacterium]|nr:PD-(D/E)XK nuclease family protein [Coriobacteriales bacterium]